MTVAVHLCRGNLKGAWMAEGGYEPVAEVLFNQHERRHLLPRVRHAARRRLLAAAPRAERQDRDPRPRITKTPQLESKDALKRRIDEAAKYVPLERLGISPQCGFSSGGGSGQTVTQDDTRRKLELVMEVAQEVWK